MYDVTVIIHVECRVIVDLVNCEVNFNAWPPPP